VDLYSEIQLVMQHTSHVKSPFLMAYDHGNMICWSWNILKSTFYWYEACHSY